MTESYPTPEAPVQEEEKKKSNTVLIIIIFVALLLCTCDPRSDIRHKQPDTAWS